MASRELGEREESERGEVGDRLVEVPDEFLETGSVVEERELELVVVSAEERGHLACIRELVACILAEAHAEGLDGPCRAARP